MENPDIQRQCGDDLMPMKLRMLANKVNGEGVGDRDGRAMRSMMIAVEQGQAPK